MRKLLIEQPIFVGVKADTRFRERLQSLDDADKKYVSHDGSTFLRVCESGDDLYVGKLIDGRLTTEQIDDISRNILSIMRKLGHEVRIPKTLQILAASSE